MPYQAITPDPGGYNIWGPRYAQSVAAPTGNPGADVLNQLVLAIRAGQEKGTYADAIRAANANQLAGAEMEARSELDKAYINNLAEITKTGLGPGVHIPGSSVVIDPTVNQQVGAVQLDKTASEAIENRASALADVAEYLDFRPPASVVGEYIGTPIQEEPTPVEPYVSFEKNTGRMKAEADMLGAQAQMVNANRPRDSGGGDGGGGKLKTYVDIPMAPGMPPTIRVVGDDPDAALAAAEKLRKQSQTGSALDPNRQQDATGGSTRQRRLRRNPDTGKVERLNRRTGKYEPVN